MTIELQNIREGLKKNIYIYPHFVEVIVTNCYFARVFFIIEAENSVKSWRKWTGEESKGARVCFPVLWLQGYPRPRWLPSHTRHLSDMPYTSHWTLHTAHGTPHTAHCTLHTAHGAMKQDPENRKSPISLVRPLEICLYFALHWCLLYLKTDLHLLYF